MNRVNGIASVSCQWNYQCQRFSVQIHIFREADSLPSNAFLELMRRTNMLWKYFPISLSLLPPSGVIRKSEGFISVCDGKIVLCYTATSPRAIMHISPFVLCCHHCLILVASTYQASKSSDLSLCGQLHCTKLAMLTISIAARIILQSACQTLLCRDMWSAQLSSLAAPPFLFVY